MNDELVCINAPVTLSDKALKVAPIAILIFAGLFFPALGIWLLVIGQIALGLLSLIPGLVLLALGILRIVQWQRGWRRAVIINTSSRSVRFEHYRLHRPRSWKILGEFHELIECSLDDILDAQLMHSRSGTHLFVVQLPQGQVWIESESAGFDEVCAALEHAAANRGEAGSEHVHS